MVSFRDERPSPEALRDIEREFAQALGFGDHQRIAGTHINTENFHRSEEHTSELQSLMRISYAVFCLKKKNTQHKTQISAIYTCRHPKKTKSYYMYPLHK